MKHRRNRVNELAAFSSIHGIPNITRTSRFKIKVYWLIFFISAASLCSLYICKSVLQYLKYEVTTNFKSVHETDFIFPSLTICNKNAFLSSFAHQLLDQLADDNNLYEIVETLDNATVKYTKLYETLKIGYFYTSSTYLNDTEKQKLGFLLHDMLLYCHHEQQVCNEDDFLWHFDYRYGNCYRYNKGKYSNGTKRNLFISRLPGKMFGLKLALFLPYNSDLQKFSLGNGMHIMINDQSYNSDYNEGFDVPVGTETSISITKSIITKLSYPYSKCKRDYYENDNFFENKEDFNNFIEQNPKYRQKDCLKLCLQKYLIKKCKCHYPLTYSFSHSFPCINVSNFQCMRNFYKNLLNDSAFDYCHELCQFECESIHFSIDTSYSQFPSKSLFENILKRKSQVISYASNSSNLNYEHLKQNFLFLNFYFEELKHLSSSEIPYMKFTELISNIGGTLGLFLGMSIMSFGEVVELMIEILCSLGNREAKKSRKPATPLA